MLNYDDLGVFGEQITNAAQIANKHNVTSFVYRTNCQSLINTTVQFNCFVVKNGYVQKNMRS